MKLKFDLLNALLDYCSKPRTMNRIDHKFRWEHGEKLTKLIINYAIKQKLLIKEPHQVKNGQKCPATWVSNSKIMKKIQTGYQNV